MVYLNAIFNVNDGCFESSIKKYMFDIKKRKPVRICQQFLKGLIAQTVSLK